MRLDSEYSFLICSTRQSKFVRFFLVALMKCLNIIFRLELFFTLNQSSYQCFAIIYWVLDVLNGQGKSNLHCQLLGRAVQGRGKDYVHIDQHWPRPNSRLSGQLRISNTARRRRPAVTQIEVTMSQYRLQSSAPFADIFINNAEATIYIHCFHSPICLGLYFTCEPKLVLTDVRICGLCLQALIYVCVTAC